MNNSILPIIPISALQRGPKKVLDQVQEYAVIRSHNRDVAFVLHPKFGPVILQMFDELKKKAAGKNGSAATGNTEKEMQRLIGRVLTELSKR